MGTADDRKELRRIDAEHAEGWGEYVANQDFNHETMNRDTTWLINTLEEYIFMRESTEK